MDIRSPIEILGAIVDEVGGYRRTDPSSYLPEPLLREARAALEESPGIRSSKMLLESTSLVGRSVEHVFDDNLKRGCLVIVCTDGSFIALDADGDEGDAYISPLRGDFGTRTKLADYIGEEDLLKLGLITKSEKDEIRKRELEKRIADAQANVARCERQSQIAQKELERLQANS